MDYYDSSKFYSSFSSDDKIKIIFCFLWGQYYNIQIDERQTVKENIIRLISGTFSGLKDFVETYLKMELRRINNADIAFDTIANGAFHCSDILSKSQIETSTTLNNIIQKLIKLKSFILYPLFLLLLLSLIGQIYSTRSILINF